MRIGFLSPWDVSDPSAWSGVVQPMFRALSDRADVLPIPSGDIRDGLVDRFVLRTLGDRMGTYIPAHALHTALLHGRVVTRRVADAHVDAVVAVAASTDLAFLGGRTPVVQVSDTTLTAIRDYYPLYSNLSPLLLPQARLVTRRANARASHTVAATQWAADALIRDDGVTPDSITVAPFGPAIAAPAEPVIRSFDPERPRLLLVASDWERKGGDLAVEAFTRVRRRIPEATLTVVGDAPGGLPPGIATLGRVGRGTLASLYRASDILVELARGNAAGVTLTDAAGFGLVAVAAATGGVPTIVLDGRTGALVAPSGDLAGAAADRIVALCREPGTVSRLARAAREHALATLDWGAWAGTVLARCFVEAGTGQGG